MALEGAEPTARVAVRWYLIAEQACLSLQRSLIRQNHTSQVDQRLCHKRELGI